MTWGTRTLVLALLVLLHIGTTIWAAPHENHQKEHGAAPTPLSLDKQKRQSDTSEILIESIADDDSHGIIPLLLGLLVLGTLILLALLLLGCLLLIRVAETRYSKYRLLQSDDPDAAHGQPTTNSKPSQTFTYVDLSNMECACQDRTTGGHTTVVQPKFAVQFQTASRVEASVPQMVAYFDRGQSSKHGLDKGELIRNELQVLTPLTVCLCPFISKVTFFTAHSGAGPLSPGEK
ncbi:hypothetical protein IscW_ISCW021844 [Ixodes scapularis]|uniref:Uncharacterized protein n=1 Tax=Ixodes scapularis TaxID=6945 RepID=B7Q5C7_IXOSC|nr:hypothetical protein IscW_ISCW021844 [Ixodes scapularis]|eukprot:XP_002411735.1 hypothetical protein IscW_ISCW021844 [Ixodes scapularis]